MKKYLLLLIVVIIITSFSVIAIDSESCQDSDGGINYNAIGTVKSSSGFFNFAKENTPFTWTDKSGYKHTLTVTSVNPSLQECTIQLDSSTKIMKPGTSITANGVSVELDRIQQAPTPNDISTCDMAIFDYIGLDQNVNIDFCRDKYRLAEVFCKMSSSLGKSYPYLSEYSCSKNCQNGACINFLPDLTIQNINFVSATNIGKEVILTFEIINKGTANSGKVEWTVDSLNPHNGYNTVGRIIHDDCSTTLVIAPSAGCKVSLGLTFNDPGYKIIPIIADYAGLVEETDETNNNVVLDLIVQNASFSTCQDSDGGIDYYKKGFASGGIGEIQKAEDKCSTDPGTYGLLFEYYCKENILTYTNYNCPNGCQDGACVKGTSECIDSDGGQDYYVKGKMSHGGIVLQDSCADEYNLNEFYCNKEGGSSSETFRCQYGCKNGACVKETVCGNDICEVGEEKTCITDCRKCIDSDNGKDYYVRGYVSFILPEGKGIGGEDSCDDSNVGEFYCKEDGSYEKDTFLCPYGCKDGACIPFLEKPGEIEVPEEKITSSTECAPKYCSVISEKCIGNDKITIEECKIYVRNYIKKAGFCEQVVYTNSKILKNTCSEEKTNGVLDCQGCLIDKNTCVPFGIRLKNKDVEYYCDVSKEMFKQKENKESCQNSYECISSNCKSGFCKPICEGCLNDNNICIPIGTRTEIQYCDIEYSFKDQKLEDNSCNNNYECSSNLCINNKCISPSFIQKIIDWFKKLFG